MSRGSFPGGGSFVGRPPAPARRPPCPWGGESLEQPPSRPSTMSRPIPRSATCATPVGASLAMSRLAVFAPREVGRKATPTAQLAPAPPAAPHPFELIANCEPLAPPSATPLTCSGAVPVLLTVTVCTALVANTPVSGNAIEAGLTAIAGAMPVPLSATERGLPGALSVNVRLAVRAPVAAGAKPTSIVHVCPEVRLPPRAPSATREALPQLALP